MGWEEEIAKAREALRGEASSSEAQRRNLLSEAKDRQEQFRAAVSEAISALNRYRVPLEPIHEIAGSGRLQELKNRRGEVMHLIPRHRYRQVGQAWILHRPTGITITPEGTLLTCERENDRVVTHVLFGDDSARTIASYWLPLRVRTSVVNAESAGYGSFQIGFIDTWTPAPVEAHLVADRGMVIGYGEDEQSFDKWLTSVVARRIAEATP